MKLLVCYVLLGAALLSGLGSEVGIIGDVAVQVVTADTQQVPGLR